jgi:ketosteroid isomerase-like protein
MPATKPQDIHTLFLDAFNRGNVDALVALYEANALLVTANGPAVGHTAIRKAYQHILADGAHMELTTHTVLDSGGRLAVLHAGWTYHRNGTATLGLSTEVVRRQPDGSWLFVIDEPRTPDRTKP